MKNILILSIVQGICEWFPVSSSGHLFLFHKILGVKQDINLDIFLHFSSLFVIFVFFRKEILKILKGFFSLKKENEDFKMAIYILSGTIITCLIGFLLKDKDFLENKNIVSLGFLITTILLFFSDKKGERKVDLKSSLIIGFSQGIALIPGVSRSGATISTAKILGINNQDSFNFSFLLAIPAITGALILKINEIKNIKLDYMICAFLVSFFTGMITLFLLKKILMKRKIKYFFIYTFIIFLFSLFVN